MYTTSPFIPHDFASLERDRALLPGTTEAGYNAWVDTLRQASHLSISRIEYESDGLNVTGVEVLPKSASAKMPLVIYNRGGHRSFGILAAGQIMALMAPLAERLQAGVLGSNYRGNDGGEGEDLFGGDDVQDVLRLVELGKKQPWWDGKNIFMYGWSRGGMMTYMALRRMNLTAAATTAGMSDIFQSAATRPNMVENIYSKVIPGWPDAREEGLRERSATHWPHEIATPLLLQHGDADDKVDVEHSRRLASLLEAQGMKVKYIEYEGDDHGLRKNNRRSMNEIINWFEIHRKD